MKYFLYIIFCISLGSIVLYTGNLHFQGLEVPWLFKIITNTFMTLVFILTQGILWWIWIMTLLLFILVPMTIIFGNKAGLDWVSNNRYEIFGNSIVERIIRLIAGGCLFWIGWILMSEFWVYVPVDTYNKIILGDWGILQQVRDFFKF